MFHKKDPPKEIVKSSKREIQKTNKGKTMMSDQRDNLESF